MLRRKRLPAPLRDAHRTFQEVTEHLARAHAALAEAAPTTRFAGRPLPDALVIFEEELRAALTGMQGWRTPELTAVWDRCLEGLSASLSAAERLRLEAPPIAGFEALIGTIDGLLAPLDPFEEASERFRRLRR
ncbi:MAG: hypothetical protein M3O84_07615 [Actinomycetota bacterium]|nr:hypothetical protein [Actinomycetota bacterium]